jgi:uncharacterized protein
MGSRQNLTRRLGVLRQTGPAGQTGGGRENRPDHEAPPPPPGWQEAAPLVYRKVTIHSLPPPLCPSESPLLKALYPGADIPYHSREAYRFFDLETTGLSGGAGNLAFLAGVGRYRGEGFEVTQLFLSDYPGEGAFLDLLLPLLAGGEYWVSYNGRSFDTPLLRSRCLMNRRILEERTPVDLLYPARRLWRGLIPDCSLGTVEREILIKSRELDIPGEEIPARFFSYLSERDPGLLEPVFSHHREDILSLAALLGLMEKLLMGALKGVPRDLYGLGRLYLPWDPERAVEALQQGAGAGDIKCALLLGGWLKRAGQRCGAVAVWEDLWKKRGNRIAARELAVHWEHREKEYHRALEIVQAVLGQPFPPRDEEKEAWERRRRRLERKAGLSDNR